MRTKYQIQLPIIEAHTQFFPYSQLKQALKNDDVFLHQNLKTFILQINFKRMEEIGPDSSNYCCASPISSTSRRHASNSSTDDQSTSSDLLSGQSSQPISPIPSSSEDKRVDREQKECGEELREHCWYWGTATKEQISAAMENQPNGTFSIRDASTKGQFTLTLRIDGTNKLIKIMVEKDKCGFTPDCLDFESIADLVQFYRTCSLRDFNERLDTCLLHPLISPEWQARQQQKLISDGGKSKSKILDPLYRTSLLKCRLEGLHAEYDRISRRYDQLFSQQLSLADEHKRKQQTAKAYSDALKVFQRKIGELKKTMTEVIDLNDRDQEALAMNVELQEERMEEIGKAQSLMKNAIQNIGQTLFKIAEELEELKPKLLKLKRDKCRDKLLAMPKRNQQPQITHAQLDRLIQGVSIALDSEPISLSAFLLRTPLRMPKWDCENWLWHSATKDQSTAFIRALIKHDQSDGIFLIRPSTSRPGFYALEISKDENVHSCLIEYRDPRTAPIDHNGGYGFAQTQMLFSSLVDFVRYYSVVPLKEHNIVLDTPLISPALGLHKKMDRKKNAGKFDDNGNSKEEAIKLVKDDEK